MYKCDAEFFSMCVFCLHLEHLTVMTSSHTIAQQVPQQRRQRQQQQRQQKQQTLVEKQHKELWRHNSLDWFTK